MGSERPKYNDKILSMQALAPVASFIDIKSPYILYIAWNLETVDVRSLRDFGLVHVVEINICFSVLDYLVWRQRIFGQ